MNEKFTFEGKSKKPIKVTVYLVLSFIIGFILWVCFYPVNAYSTIFWLGATVMGFPIYVAVEGLGALGLNAKWVKILPRFLRIIFGVFWVLVCISIIGLAIGLLSSMLAES